MNKIEEDIRSNEDSYTELPNGVALISTTFWEDFSIADMFNGVEDTYKRAFAEWKNDIRYITALSMVLNHKVWAWYEKDEQKARLYQKLWEKLDGYVLSGKEKQRNGKFDYEYNNYTNEEVAYYIRALD